MGNLHRWVANQAYPNFAMHSSGGGMECCNTVPACVTEMMMQSFQDVVLMFPDWPSDAYGKFGDLLANGAFLVSSEIHDGAVQYLRAISQVGGTFTFRNPWPGKTLALYKNGRADGTLSGADISVPTEANDVLLMARDGASYNSIISSMQALPRRP
jgi:hypothetical protein